MVVGGKSTLRIAFFLLRAPRRNGELKRLLPTISQQDAHPATREFAADGIVVRTVHEQVPPRVDYAVTESERRGSLSSTPYSTGGVDRDGRG